MLTQTGRGLKFGWRADLVLFYPLYMLILELNNNKTIIPPSPPKKNIYFFLDQIFFFLIKLSLEMAIERLMMFLATTITPQLVEVIWDDGK